MNRVFGLYRVDGSYAICRMGPDEKVPQWAHISRLSFISRTEDELSVICEESSVPDYVRAERGWAGFKLQGPFPLNEVGVLASVLNPLADAGISILACSSFDTDYVFVKNVDKGKAESTLLKAGHWFMD
jgi:uncharacterized protein